MNFHFFIQGYNYRLCPANNPAGLTEECFQSHHLNFVGESMLRWGGVAGKRKLFNATIVSDGTVPQGSTWVRLSLLPGFNRGSRISQPLTPAWALVVVYAALWRPLSSIAGEAFGRLFTEALRKYTILASVLKFGYCMLIWCACDSTLRLIHGCRPRLRSPAGRGDGRGTVCVDSGLDGVVFTDLSFDCFPFFPP